MSQKTVTVLASGAIVTIRGTPQSVRQIETDIREAAVQRFINDECRKGASRKSVTFRARRIERLLAS